MSDLNYQTEVCITPFVLADAHELACVDIDARKETYDWAIEGDEQDRHIAAQEEGFVARSEDQKIVDKILVARVAGKIVGYTEFGSPKEPKLTLPGAMELHRLYVLRKMHGRGPGPLLMNAALGDPVLKEAPYTYLWVWGGNDRALNFYARYGFIGRETREYIDRGNPTHDVFMVRDQT